MNSRTTNRARRYHGETVTQRRQPRPQARRTGTRQSVLAAEARAEGMVL